MEYQHCLLKYSISLDIIALSSRAPAEEGWEIE